VREPVAGAAQGGGEADPRLTGIWSTNIDKTYVRNMALVFTNDDPIMAMKKREIYHHLKDAGRNLSITVDVLHRIIVGLI